MTALSLKRMFRPIEYENNLNTRKHEQKDIYHNSQSYQHLGINSNEMFPAYLVLSVNEEC